MGVGEDLSKATLRFLPWARDGSWNSERSVGLEAGRGQGGASGSWKGEVPGVVWWTCFNLTESPMPVWSLGGEGLSLSAG